MARAARMLSIVHWLTDLWCLSRMILRQSAVRQNFSKEADFESREARSTARPVTSGATVPPLLSMFPRSRKSVLLEESLRRLSHKLMTSSVVFNAASSPAFRQDRCKSPYVNVSPPEPEDACCCLSIPTESLLELIWPTSNPSVAASFSCCHSAICFLCVLLRASLGKAWTRAIVLSLNLPSSIKPIAFTQFLTNPGVLTSLSSNSSPSKTTANADEVFVPSPLSSLTWRAIAFRRDIVVSALRHNI